MLRTLLAFFAYPLLVTAVFLGLIAGLLHVMPAVYPPPMKPEKYRMIDEDEEPTFEMEMESEQAAARVAERR